MRFMKSSSWLLALGFWLLAGSQKLRASLVKSSFSTEAWFFWLEDALLLLRRLFTGAEDPFFVASDALVGVQAFEDELGGGDLDLRAFFGTNIEFRQLVHQALDLR
jgi:hypothetical protein